MYKFNSSLQSTRLVGGITKIGNGVSGDFNGDGFQDIAFSTNITSPVVTTLSPVEIYTYDPVNRVYTEYRSTINGVSGQLPRMYFGRDMMSYDFNRDGITDLIPIDQTEVRGAPGSSAIFKGVSQAAYISTGPGAFTRVDLGCGEVNVHGAGLITSADGVVRLGLNTPWSDTSYAGTAYSIAAYNAGTGQFQSQLITRHDKFFTDPGVKYGYFFTATIDVNNDNNTDIIGFSGESGQNAIYINNGHGGFNYSRSFSTGLTPGIKTEESAVGDFNGDGFDDMVILGVDRSTQPNNEYKSIRVLINDQKGSFVDQTSTWLHNQFQNMNTSFGYLETYDINQDSRSDFTITYYTGTDYAGRSNYVFLSSKNDFEVNTISAPAPRSIQLSSTQYLTSDWNGSYVYTMGATGDSKPVNPINTAVFDGASTDYTIEKGAGVTRLITKKDPTNYYLLDKSVDRLTFSDSSIALDTGVGSDQNSGQAYRLYRAALDRAPDTSGLGFWINALDNNTSLHSVAEGFVNSQEFRNKFYGDGSNSTFVTALYNNVLHRSPERSGFDYWVNGLNNGADRAGVLIGFSESPENVNQTVGLVGQGIHYDMYYG